MEEHRLQGDLRWQSMLELSTPHPMAEVSRPVGIAGREIDDHPREIDDSWMQGVILDGQGWQKW